MKVLFLDIDGVLNTYHKERDEFGQLFGEEACNNLKNIIDATGANIVITSTWRFDGLERMQAMWTLRNLAGHVIDITPDLTSKNETGIWLSAIRGCEIRQWLENHPDIKRYCILDDDNDMLLEQLSSFVRTNSYEGLKIWDTEKVIEVLNQ